MPIEFIIYKSDGSGWLIKFYYADGNTEEISILQIPKGIELNKHYSITDLYGYKVIDDRKGL